MDGRAKIPALALLGLSFTQCTGRDAPADPIIGDWRAVQVDGEKHPVMSSYYGPPFTVGEQLHIDPDLAGEMVIYQSASYDGLNYTNELVADLVVESAGAAKYRVDVAHDFLEVLVPEPYDESGYVTGYDVTGYADTGAPDPAPDTGADSGNYAEPDDEPVRPLTVPAAPALAAGAIVFDCTLDADTLTCDREGDTGAKHWVFARIQPDGE